MRSRPGEPQRLSIGCTMALASAVGMGSRSFLTNPIRFPCRQTRLQILVALDDWDVDVVGDDAVHAAEVEHPLGLIMEPAMARLWPGGWRRKVKEGRARAHRPAPFTPRPAGAGLQIAAGGDDGPFGPGAAAEPGVRAPVDRAARSIPSFTHAVTGRIFNSGHHCLSDPPTPQIRNKNAADPQGR